VHRTHTTLTGGRSSLRHIQLCGGAAVRSAAMSASIRRYGGGNLPAVTGSAEMSALRAGGDQELACGVTLSSEVVETAAGRKPRAIIQTASTISCTARGMTNKLCAVESVPRTPYIAST